MLTLLYDDALDPRDQQDCPEGAIPDPAEAMVRPRLR